MASGRTAINLPEGRDSKLVSHPAKYSTSIMAAMAEMIPAGALVLDPFAGTGRIHDIGRMCGARTVGVELEPEWAGMSPGTIVGDATSLPFAPETFDVAATSPAYGNRLADSHNARDGSVRHSYTHDLGRRLHPHNAGAMQWGGRYRAMHETAWAEVATVLRPGGTLVLNVSDHVRKSVVQPVTAWHIETLRQLGFIVVEHRRIPTPRLRFGRNGGARVDHESIVRLVFRGATRRITDVVWPASASPSTCRRGSTLTGT